MDLISAITIDCAFKFIVCLLLLLKYINTKSKITLFWTMGWMFFGMHALFELFLIWTGSDFWLFARHIVWGLTAVAFLQSAVYLVEDSVIERYRVNIFLVLLIVITSYLGVYYFRNWFAGAFPASLINGMGFLVAAYYFNYYRRENDNIATRLIFLGFLLNGLHNLDYPFLRNVEWFAPIGFSLGVVFSLMVAVGLMLVAYVGRYKYGGKGDEKV